MNHLKSRHGEEPNEPPRECKSQPTSAELKSSTSPNKTSPVVSAIMGILNNHAIYNIDVEFHPS